MTSSGGEPRNRIFKLLRSGAYADPEVDPFELAKERPFFAPDAFDGAARVRQATPRQEAVLASLPQIRIQPDGVIQIIPATAPQPPAADAPVESYTAPRSQPSASPVLRWPTEALAAFRSQGKDQQGATLRWPDTALATMRSPAPSAAGEACDAARPSAHPLRWPQPDKATPPGQNAPEPIAKPVQEPPPKAPVEAKHPTQSAESTPVQEARRFRPKPAPAATAPPPAPVPEGANLPVAIPKGPRTLDVPEPWRSPFPPRPRKPRRPLNLKPLRVAGVITARLAVGTVSASLVTAATVLLALVYLFARDLPGPDALASYHPPLITEVRSADGQLLDEFATERRIYVTTDEVPRLVKAAVISAEDKNFYAHSGYDLRAMAHAAADAVTTRGETLRGASTITQQVMKNFLLSDMPLAERKIKEIVLANRIERVLGKDRILELYLNEIFLGQNAYGIAAAARTYFNKPLDALTVGEAATLAALPKSPSNLHPVRNMTRLRARRNYVLQEMHENGFISEDVFEREIWEPLRSVQNGDMVAYGADRPPRNYFTDEIRRQLSARLGSDTFMSGGLTVKASVDLDMQNHATLALQRGLETYDRRQGLWRPTGLAIAPDRLTDEADWRAALARLPIARDIDLDGRWYPAVVLEAGPRSARIGIEDVPEDADGHWIGPNKLGWARRMNADGTRGGRARGAGDLLKTGEVVHVSAVTDESGDFLRWSLRQVPEVQGGFLAMEIPSGRIIAMQGGFSYQASSYNRATQAKRQPGSAFKPIVFAAALDKGYSPASKVSDDPIEIETESGVWRPQNYSRDSLGDTTLRIGLERSRNLMTVRLAEEIGMDTIAAYAERMGAYDHLDRFMAVSLGAQGTSLARMVSAYGTIANGGQRVTPKVVDYVTDRDGGLMDVRGKAEMAFAGAGAQALDPVTAYQLTSMLRGVVERGTARSAVDLPVPAAGKTGTTNGAKDVWFVGFTSNIVAGCYMGFDAPRTLGAGSFGGSMCAPVFQDFMKHAVEKYGGEEFAIPEGGTFVKHDRRTGDVLEETAQGSHVIEEFLRTAPIKVEGVGIEDSITALVVPQPGDQQALGQLDQN